MRDLSGTTSRSAEVEGNGIFPTFLAGDQPQPRVRVSLHHIGRGAACMTGPVNALHGDEGRDTNFHTAAGSDLGCLLYTSDAADE